MGVAILSQHLDGGSDLNKKHSKYNFASIIITSMLAIATVSAAHCCELTCCHFFKNKTFLGGFLASLSSDCFLIFPSLLLC